MATTVEPVPSRRRETLDSAVIRFAGDSGDGMQITGSQFTNTTALFGNDLATFPDYPAEIRAPAGTLPGVSGFQIHFGSSDVYTPGDAVDVLVAMNPAALKVNLPDLKTGGILIVNTDAFKETDLRKAQLAANPLEDQRLEGYRLFPVELAALTRAALKELGLDAKSMDRCKNFFALGMCYWLYNRIDGRDAPLARRQVQGEAAARRGEHAGDEGRLRLLRGDRGVPGQLRDPAGEARAGPLPQHHRQHGARARARRRLAEVRAAAVPGQLPDHAGLRHPARAVGVQGVRRHHLPGRGRDRGDRVGDRRRLRGRARDHDHLGPGHGAQDRGDRPGDDDRAAARDRQHPARRAVDRPADQDRAGRPAAGAVRPQLRGARPGDRGVDARATASGSRSRPAASRSSTWCR